ncbi:MAG TPA: L-ribulose-5-phosphate 4-epimerase [Calditrichia bacterium]|nr:L-ribulose-5-phosphate 4-epimerase [Calditrichota bacterium]HQU71961.1 L-ribulose-5-phosphate 4-epimerase [Calditrichia bacterium]HQV32416.1 L-ribulose-5-phosphate 4-epimerase [Calditrichia bacterium]
MSKYKALKQESYEVNMALAKSGLVIATFGNVSALDRSLGVFAIKPSGVAYEDLKAEDIVVVDLDGKVVEGRMRPSSDTNTHMMLYRHFPSVGGIVHTHSTYAVAWAQAALPLPILGTTHADHLHMDVPCTDFMSDEMIKGDYEIETGNQILKRFQGLSSEEVEMVLVAGHGPFTWGKTAQKALYNSVILEEMARMALFTLQINPDIGRLPAALIDKHYQRKHGPNAYYGQGGY